MLTEWPRGALVVAGGIIGLSDAAMPWWFQNAIEFTGVPQMTSVSILVVVDAICPTGLLGTLRDRLDNTDAKWTTERLSRYRRLPISRNFIAIYKRRI